MRVLQCLAFAWVCLPLLFRASLLLLPLLLRSEAMNDVDGAVIQRSFVEENAASEYGSLFVVDRSIHRYIDRWMDAQVRQCL
jgi:hypothetical protein